jgi:hypothetical protein
MSPMHSAQCPFLAGRGDQMKGRTGCPVPGRLDRLELPGGGEGPQLLDIGLYL